MEEEIGHNSAARRSSSRAKKIGVKVGAALADPHVRAQAARDRLDALESDSVAPEPIDLDDDEDVSMDEDDAGGGAFAPKIKVPKSTKRKTRRAAKEMEMSDKRAPRTFLEILEDSKLEALPAHVPTYLTAAVGPPSSAARRHFCSVCGYLAPYTCTKCGVRFCSGRCKVVHDDTRCQKFLM